MKVWKVSLRKQAARWGFKLAETRIIGGIADGLAVRCLESLLNTEHGREWVIGNIRGRIGRRVGRSTRPVSCSTGIRAAAGHPGIRVTPVRQKLTLGLPVPVFAGSSQTERFSQPPTCLWRCF